MPSAIRFVQQIARDAAFNLKIVALSATRPCYKRDLTPMLLAKVGFELSV